MLPPLKAARDFIEQQTSLPDPAERDRALADIQHELEGMLSAVGTYRGDAQRQADYARQMADGKKGE
jgi:hypothetical protein